MQSRKKIGYLPLVASAIALAVYILVSDPGPWVGTWAVDKSALQATINGNTAQLPFGASIFSRAAKLADATLDLRSDGSWSGNLPGVLASLPLRGRWQADHNSLVLYVDDPPGKAINAVRNGSHLETTVQFGVARVAIPFTRR